MALYSLIYLQPTGQLVEIGPAGTEWVKSSDPDETAKFRIEDNKELSEAMADAYKLMSLGGGGDGRTLPEVGNG